MLFEACEKSVLLACLWGDCVTDILQTVRWGMQVGKMERVSLKKIVGIYQLKGKHISQVWEVKKESCFSALISCNVKNHCTTELWKAQVFNKRTYIKCILKNSVSSLVYFYFDFWVFLPHSVTISAGSWVDGLQELLRVPWHLFRWVKEGAAGCMIQHFIKSCGSLRPPGWWAVPCAQDGASLERTPLSAQILPLLAALSDFAGTPQGIVAWGWYSRLVSAAGWWQPCLRIKRTGNAYWLLHGRKRGRTSFPAHTRPRELHCSVDFGKAKFLLIAPRAEALVQLAH